jgi:hypothetical protein
MLGGLKKGPFIGSVFRAREAACRQGLRLMMHSMLMYSGSSRSNFDMVGLFWIVRAKQGFENGLLVTIFLRILT